MINQPTARVLQWIQQEEALGAPSAFRAVLSSIGVNGAPHARIVAIKEIAEDKFVFFTQKRSRKYAELCSNKAVSLTFWLELQQREVMIDGYVETLTIQENQCYWDTLSKERQAHFAAYSPTSGQKILDNGFILEQEIQLMEAYKDKIMPLSEHYRGFRVIPERYVFYTLSDEGVSEIHEYTRMDGEWGMAILSP